MDNNSEVQIKCKSCGKLAISSQMRMAANGKDMICQDCAKKGRSRDTNLKNVARL